MVIFIPKVRIPQEYRHLEIFPKHQKNHWNLQSFWRLEGPVPASRRFVQITKKVCSFRSLSRNQGSLQQSWPCTLTLAVSSGSRTLTRRPSPRVAKHNLTRLQQNGVSITFPYFSRIQTNLTPHLSQKYPLTLSKCDHVTNSVFKCKSTTLSLSESIP